MIPDQTSRLHWLDHNANIYKIRLGLSFLKLQLRLAFFPEDFLHCCCYLSYETGSYSMTYTNLDLTPRTQSGLQLMATLLPQPLRCW